ncbi:uncharacterized protein LOC103098148 [Monodelphis domestica]|uniref:Uncharacterized LOC103098148 n=1 Tax=Monodelphis domestica TaxID=13616 RepID=K7E3E3_MONDO|nr:uncharacterized protein LOC103098148 [Monodelphis domestica]
MNASPASGTGSRPEGNNGRPFFYAQPTAQTQFPNPWYLNPVYSPYCVSAAGFRNGNPFIPYYSVALPEYPGFLLPRAPVPTRMNRRPYFHPQLSFPMFQHATHFPHYNSPGKKKETKETQTDPQQHESKHKRQHVQLDSSGCKNMRSSKGIMTNIASEKSDAVLSSLVQDGGLHSKSPSATMTHRSIPPGSYTLEKEEVRIEYGNGSPATQFWNSFKENIPIYNLTPENIVQCDLFSVSSCERLGVLYTPHKREVPTVEYSEEDKAGVMLTKQCHETVKDKEIQMPGPSLEGSLDKYKKNIQKCSNLLDAANQWQSDDLNRSGKKIHSMANPRLSVSRTPNRSTQELSQQAGSICSSMEAINGLSQGPPSPNKYNGQTKLRDNFWRNELGKIITSPTWLALFEKVDASIRPLPQRKSPSVTSMEPSSIEEESSLDNLPMTDFVPEKNMYSKSTESIKQEEVDIQDDHDNEEEEEGLMMMVGEVDGVVVQDAKENSRVKLKEPMTIGREQEALPRYLSQKTHLLKKKRECLSDLDSEDLLGIEDDADDDLDEVKYIFEAIDPQEDLTPSNEIFYQEIGRRVIWKPPHSTMSPQLIVWPVKNKGKKKIGAYESAALFHKLKDRDYYETVYGKLMKRQIMGKQEVKLDRSKRKMLHKHKNMRPEAETVEVWAVPKCSAHRGYGLRKTSH